MKNLFILLALTIVLSSCKQKKEVSDNIIDLTLITEPTVTNLSELGSEITYLPLETDESCQIAQIDKLIFEGESYFLRTTNQNFVLPEKGSAPPPPPMSPIRSLYRFSKNGEFICQISRNGRGPSEYQGMDDFLYNKGNNTINIFYLNYIKEFSLDGIWKKDITFDDYNVGSLSYTNNQILLYIYNSDGKNEDSFILIDANGQISNKYKNKYKFATAQSTYFYPGCMFYQYNDILHSNELHSDTIFSFENGTFIPKYIFKQGEAKFASELREDPPNLYKNKSKLIIQKKLFESKNYLFYQYDWKYRDNFLIQNKSNGTQYLIDNKIGLVNDLDNGPNFKIQNRITVDGVEYLVSWINAFELKAHVASDEFKTSTPKYPEKKKQLEQLANSLDENDNPVLMLVKLNEFQ